MSIDRADKFIVLTTNRSGSEWMMSTLNSFPDVFAHSELFLPRPQVSEGKWNSDFAYPRFVESKVKGPAIRPFSVFSYLNTFYSMPGKVGFKLMYKQLGLYPEILGYLLKHRVRVIHLMRQNHLDVMLSYAVKAKLGQSHLLAGQSAPDELRVQLDTRTLVRKLAWLQEQQNIARRLLKFFGLPHVEVIYEDLVRNHTLFLRIAEFLSINAAQQIPKSALTKIRKEGHRDVIRNYDEVKEVLVNSKFAGLLE
jgi:LPS sulfotransferase NodH